MARNKDFFVNSAPKRDRSFFVKEDTTPNVLQKQNITKDFKTLDIGDFVNTVKNSPETKKAQLTAQASEIEKQIKQKEQEYNRANNYSNWDEKMKAKTNIGNELNSLRTQLDNTRTQIDEIAGNPNDKLLTPEQVKEYNKNAPLSNKIDRAIKQDIPRTAEKVGRTAMDLLGSGLVGATNAVEGMADAAVGNLGALASGVTSGFGLAPNKVSDKIKERAERFTKFNFSGEELLEEKKNEGTGVYEPKILGIKVRDALNTISNMVTSATFGGVPGFMASAAGQNIEQALNDNQSLNRAVVYGDIAGAVEGLTEKMFDAVNLLGGGKFDKFIPKGAIGKLIGGSAGEAIEEVVSEGINPFLKYLTYEKGSYDMPTLVEYLNTLKESAWNGFVIGLIMKGGQDISTPQIREQYKEEIYTAVDKSNLPENVKQTVKEVMITSAQAQINQDLQNYRNKFNQTPNLTIQRENVTGLPKLNVQNQAQTQNIEQANVTLPNQAEMAQNANMEQIRDNAKLITQRDEQTLQSAKIAGMTDMDIQKAKELNDMLRSGARLKFYDPQNIPQGVDVSRAADANGFYMDGTLWINKNSEMKVERILGHELTHHVENDDLINTILDSNIFYDFLSEKGFSNTAEFKKYLMEKKGYKQEELTSEMVAHFAEEKLFGKEETINRLARENRTLAQKILNWISDLRTKIAGSTEAKELLKIENMYRKALEQARNVDKSSTDAQYSIAGVKGARRLRKNLAYRNIMENYKSAKKFFKEGYDNARLIEETGWYRDNEGNWKYEFSDEDMTLKENIKLDNKKIYPLDKMLKHDVLFEAYPQLRNYTVILADIGSEHRAGIFSPAKIILLNPNYANTKESAEYELAHEIQHAIQVIEGFPGAATNKNGKYAYYTSLGEIEARDVSERLRMLQNQRKQYIPETAKENPTHEGLERYLNRRTEGERLKDEEYIQRQEARDNLKKSIKNFFGGGVGYAQDIDMDNSQNNTEAQSKANRVLHNENIENKRLAGKEPAFSMPETDNQGRTLSKEQQEFFKDSKVRDAEGNLKPVYHGTKRADRVGYYFDPAKATSGPMAFFTDDVEIATNYSKSKQDTSISREADTEYDLFKVNGKDLDSYWDSLSPKQKRDIAEKGNNIGFDEDWENVVYGENASEESFGDQYKWRLNREYNGNAIKALYGIWIEDGNLMFEDMAKFKDILNMAGIENVEYLDKFKEEPKVYEVYMNLKNPFVTSDINQEIINKLQKASENATIGEQYTADSWDKSNIEPKDWMSMLRDDIKNNTTHSWTIIPDWVTNVLKSEGYDGIQDTGGKYSGLQHNVYIPFYSNQIKETSNTNPTENPDIRYSMNPVEVAKNPPNIETGLDQLKRTSRVKEGDTQSNFTRNIYNQSIFDDKFKDLALDDKNIRSYASISNKETLQEANDAINEQGQKWVDRFLDKPNGEMKATDIAGGFILMNRYQQAGDYESMIRVAEKLRKAGTQQGQTIQMFSVLGRMTPEGMTYYAQKELSKAYDEILKNKTQKWADEHADEFKLNEKDIEYIQRRVTQAARLPEGRDKYVLLGEIASRIQNKIPPQAGQGLKALARNSMLLNPKTMVRNILGNVVIVPNHIVSDFIGAGIDKAISKKTGVRTTGGFDVKSLQGAKKGIYESFDDFRRKISTREMGGDRFEINREITQGKTFYENHTGRFGETRNKINKALNGLDRVTGFLLETGDRPFYETWFINSLNNQMKLNNVTEPTAEMIEIATDEALQRTWQDNNSYTRVVKSVRDGLNKLNVKGYGLGDMVMPFVKTPANLTKAVIDFSPLGAINAAVKTSQFTKDIGKGTATTKQQREVVKAWSQVITGTLGMAMLTALANAGVLTGGSDEDKDVRAFEQNILGIKPYSIKIGDKTYTYDWAQPLGTSAAMVADTVKSLKNAKDTEGKVAAILEGAQSGASVLLEQSFVSGIRNLFEEDNLINALIETGFNETSKFTPQFLSQLAQIQDDTARTSYVYNNIPQTALNKVKAKIPGLRQTLEPSVDVLGREVKTDNSVGNVMFNPANTAFARTTEGAEEMYRVYQATGDKATIAQVAPYYFNVGSEKIVLTPKQRTQYQKTIGKIASDGVENLLKNKAYKSLEDTDKAEILKDLYSYGTAIAKEEASTSYLLPSEMEKIKNSGMKPEEYILAKYISNSEGKKKDEMYNALISAGYSEKKTEDFLSYYKGYKFDSTSKNTLPTLSSQRAKLPTLKK